MATDYRETDEQNTLKRAQILGLDYLDVRTLVKRPVYKGLIKDELMQEYNITPIISTKDHLTIGITTTTPTEILEDIRRIYNSQRVRFVLISKSSLRDYFELYNPPKRVIYENIALSTSFDDEQVKAVTQALVNIRSEDMLAYLVDQAFRLKISDIHCENDEKTTKIRMRVDGILYPVIELSKDQYRVLLGAIASAANLSTAAEDSQTGRIGQRHTMKDGTVVVMNLRVETIPTIHGMDVVMRFFSFDEKKLSLDKLGMSGKQMSIIQDIIKYPRGMVLVVGPTGSGKTTTLYSMLAELRSPKVKIITLENPVELEMKYITQIPIDVDEGASFAKGLRTVLRFDPDIVMVGEIRDNDTASTALRAALTGHLVLSTYHATTAVLALINILQMANSQEDPLFLNAIRLVQGQRLVRRLDPKTKQAYRPTSAERQQIEAIVQTMSPQIRPKLEPDFKLYKPGSSPENPLGYIGRFAIRELLVLDDEVRTHLITQLNTVNPQKLSDYLCQNNKLITMLQEGVLRVLEGETTMEEIYRTGA